MAIWLLGVFPLLGKQMEDLYVIMAHVENWIIPFLLQLSYILPLGNRRQPLN